MKSSLPRVMVLAGLSLAVWVLCACGGEDTTAQSQRRDQPVTVLIWDPDIPRPRILIADSASQEGPRLRQTRFSGVMLRMPMDQGELILHTDHALIDQGADDQAAITLYPPLLVTGTVEGFPLQGRARAVTIDMPGMDVVLREVEWIHAGQRVSVERVEFANTWQERRAQGLRGEPADGPFLASQAALPENVVFPAYQRPVTVSE
ncbi:MAG: hypothetical protein EA401_10740 [Planctomycetota bacterium]|nr:MAG: hypothetical protein EA401_10740 [Planctomycetota bacterium]